MNQELAKKIKTMFQEDQDLRNKIFTPDYSPTDADWDELQRLDDLHKEEIKKILNEIGFPTISKVGKEASYQTWLLAQEDIIIAETDLEYLRTQLANASSLFNHSEQGSDWPQTDSPRNPGFHP